ncbi:hypothetical protein BJL57_09405 [Campylobacter jejuni]|nr:hypothetical protein [Campylobacter jejuni]
MYTCNIEFNIEKYNIQIGGGLYQYLNYECLLNLLKFGKNDVQDNKFYIITSLVSDEYVFLFLKVNQKFFILVQKFSIDMVIDIESNKINILSKISKEQVENALNTLKMKISFLYDNNIDFYKIFYIYNYEKLETSRKILFLNSYPRPWHYFQDFLCKFFIIKNKIMKDRVISILSLVKNEYIDLNYDDIVTYEFISDDAANQFIIENDFVVWRPIRNFITKDECTFNMKEKFYFWLKNISLKNSLEFRNSIIQEIIKYKYKIWISVARQGRKWIEQEQGIIELSESLRKMYGDEVCIVLDSLTSSLYYGKEAYGLINMDEIFYIHSLSKNLKIKSFNIFGFSSAEKINIAHCVDFYIGNMNTDMLYPCYIAKKHGVCYGSVENYDIKKQDEEILYLNFFPIEHVKTVNPRKIYCRSDYSINPFYFAKYVSQQIYFYFTKNK